MNPEDRLRDATRAYTDPIQPAPDAWARIRGRVDPETRPGRARAGRLALAGFATALVIALVVALVTVVRDDNGGGGSGVAAGPGLGEARPEQIVAVTDDGRLVLLDSSTGAELRELADKGATTIAAGSNIAVSPDGSTIYFVRTIDATCAGAPLTEVARVELETGAVETVVGGVRYPALSPNGRFLAFTGIPNCSDAGNAILIMDLETGGGAEFRNETWPIQQGIGFLSWASDSRHLTFTPFDAPGGSFPRVLDTTTDMSLDEAPRVLNPDGSRINGYYGRDLLIGTLCSVPGEPLQTRIVTFDAVSGDIEQTLFRIPEECGGQLAVADATSDNILVVSRGLPVLYRWSVGTEPMRIADGIVAAAWLPGGPTAPPPTTTEIVQIPNVLGLDPNTARRQLERDGFGVEVQYGTPTGAPGLVVEQEPRPGTRASLGSRIAIVVDAFLPCGGFFRPTALPEGFASSSVTGPAAESSVPVAAGASVVHYTGGNGRSIEIRRPATLFTEVLGRDDDPPDAYILGQPVQIEPIAPTVAEPLLAQFTFPSGSLDDLCRSYSVNGYGVSESELRTFAESLVPVP